MCSHLYTQQLTIPFFIILATLSMSNRRLLVPSVFNQISVQQCLVGVQNQPAAGSAPAVPRQCCSHCPGHCLLAHVWDASAEPFQCQAGISNPGLDRETRLQRGRFVFTNKQSLALFFLREGRVSRSAGSVSKHYHDYMELKTDGE